jgi:hypothetical protein
VRVVLSAETAFVFGCLAADRTEVCMRGDEAAACVRQASHHTPKPWIDVI